MVQDLDRATDGPDVAARFAIEHVGRYRPLRDFIAPAFQLRPHQILQQRKHTAGFRENAADLHALQLCCNALTSLLRRLVSTAVHARVLAVYAVNSR